MKKVKVENRKRFVGDFETEYVTDEQIKAGAHTYVWAWALYNCETEQVEIGSDIYTYFCKLFSLPHMSTVYFHNEKFDASFMLNYLLKNQFKQVDARNPYTLKDKEFIVYASGLGVFYALIICNNNKLYYIYDSLKKLPFKVAEIAKKLNMEQGKGEIDYKQHREEGAPLSPQDADYITRDVTIVGKALQKMYFDRGFYGMTIGADCMNFYKNMCKQFANYYPVLDEKEDAFARKTYNGGKSYIEPKYRNVEIGEGLCYDVNGLYSAMMLNNPYPIGKGVYYTGKYTQDDTHPLYLQHIRCALELKPGFTPTLQLKGNMLFKANEFITTTHGEIVDLYLTCIDLEMLLKHYKTYMYDPDDSAIEYVDGYKYQQSYHLFDKYINYWADLKEKAGKENDAFTKLLCKNFLNNLYGKFGTNPDASNLVFEINDAKLCRKSNPEKRTSVYCPLASFVTAYGRKFLNEAIQANYDRFIYCDTDSIFIIGTDPVQGIQLDDFKLGAWKLDKVFTKAKFIRQKTYAYYNDGWHFKCAGLPNSDDVLTYDKFYAGSVIDNAKLISKQIPGGIVLTPTTFKIKSY